MSPVVLGNCRQEQRELFSCSGDTVQGILHCCSSNSRCCLQGLVVVHVLSVLLGQSLQSCPFVYVSAVVVDVVPGS